MSLLDKIENLQKKPESYRRKILFVSVFLLMFAVVLFWMSAPFDQWKEKEDDLSDSPAKILSKDAVKMKEVFDSSVGQLKNMIESL